MILHASRANEGFASVELFSVQKVLWNATQRTEHTVTLFYDRRWSEFSQETHLSLQTLAGLGKPCTAKRDLVGSLKSGDGAVKMAAKWQTLHQQISWQCCLSSTRCHHVTASPRSSVLALSPLLFCPLSPRKPRTPEGPVCVTSYHFHGHRFYFFCCKENWCSLPSHTHLSVLVWLNLLGCEHDSAGLRKLKQ
jgi:hypothetical protein